MHKIRTEFEFEAAHKLNLTYESKCRNLHGHSYKCAVTVRGESLDENNMLFDFTILKNIAKERIENKLDHAYLNDIFEVNATAEYMAKWICDEVNDELSKRPSLQAKCVMVELNETSKNKAIWEED